jgi:hypothetical protein
MRSAIVVFGLLLTSIAVTALPAQASISTISCNPSASSWDTKGAWPDGTVLEARACLQHDSAVGDMRVKEEWRVRRGGTAIGGTDWDLDSGTDGRPYITHILLTVSGTKLGNVQNYPDVYNTSIVTLYSNWACNLGSGTISYVGKGFDLRATPPGLAKSGYKSQNTLSRSDSMVQC